MLVSTSVAPNARCPSRLPLSLAEPVPVSVSPALSCPVLPCPPTDRLTCNLSAIFCGSASSLKVCIQARFPQFFGSSATNSHKKSRRSRSGPVFALKTFGGSPMTPVHTAGKNTSSSSQYAGLGSTHSQEAIVGSSRDVMVKKKFWVDVSDGKGERVKHDQGVGAIP